MAHRRWPAEWESQSAIWLSWPHNRETWPGYFQGVPAAFTSFVRAVAEIVPVKVLVDPASAEAANEHLAALDHVEQIRCATNDCWIRDYGPTFVVEHDELIGIDWGYNAWGGKYPPWDADQQVAKFVCRQSGIRSETSPLIAEGGALETDGRGRLLTTPECLITATRNPGWDQERIARELHQRLGIHEILWLEGGGLEGDDTDGHIDQLARFVDPQNVVCAVSDDPADPNAEPLEKNYRQLRIWGRDTRPKVRIHRLPIPPRRTINDQRVPESYCNFLIVGSQRTSQRVIVPQFRSAESDAAAIAVLKALMPGAEIYPLDAHDLVWGLGAFHCASQQQPHRASQQQPSIHQ